MATYYWVGGSGTWNNSSKTNWATSTGGSGGFGPPLAADSVNFDSNSGTSAVVTVASTAVCTTCTINKSDLNFSLSGNVTFSGLTYLTAGTITLNNNIFTVGLFNSSNSNTRSIAFGTGSINLSGGNAAIFDMAIATGFTYSGTPTINSTYAGSTGQRSIGFGTLSSSGTSANALNIYIKSGTDAVSLGNNAVYRTIDFTGFAGTLVNRNLVIYGDLVISSGMTIAANTFVYTFSGTSGTQQITTNGLLLDFPLVFNGIGGTFAFQDALTQGSTKAFTVTNGTVQLKAGVTSTVGVFATSGTNQKYLQSTVTDSPATLSQASGTVSVSKLTIQDINAVGGATWNALYENGNVDAGDNSGWNFGGSPQTVTEVTYRLRSFTEPRRF